MLLVDDEDLVRALVREILALEGYRILEASCASEALAVEERFTGVIDLLLTDFIMPGASGAELAASMAARPPQTRVLYMSGYPGETIMTRGALGEGVGILNKPFTAEGLVERVHTVLIAGEQTIRT